MKHLAVLAAGVSLVALAASAHADVVYTLGTSNTAGLGAGPYGFLDLHLIDSTHAELNFFSGKNGGGFTYVFGEAGANINAATFGVTGSVSFTMAAGDVQTPTFTQSSGNMDGWGSFNFRETPSPNGFSDAVTALSVEIHNTSGTWATQDDVLAMDNKDQFAAEHFFANGNSAFNTNSSHCDSSTDCPIPGTQAAPVPEPGSLAIFGSAILGFGLVGWFRRRKDGMTNIAAA